MQSKSHWLGQLLMIWEKSMNTGYYYFFCERTSLQASMWNSQKEFYAFQFQCKTGCEAFLPFCLPVVCYYILLHQKKRAVQVWGLFVVAPSAIHHLFPSAAVGALLLWLQITIQRLVADLLSSCKQVSLPLKLHDVDSFFHFSFGWKLTIININRKGLKNWTKRKGNKRLRV